MLAGLVELVELVVVFAGLVVFAAGVVVFATGLVVFVLVVFVLGAVELVVLDGRVEFEAVEELVKLLLSARADPAGVVVPIMLSAFVFNAQRRIDIAIVIFHITVNKLLIIIIKYSYII